MVALGALGYRERWIRSIGVGVSSAIRPKEARKGTSTAWPRSRMYAAAVGVSLLIFSLISSTAQATIITYELVYEFSAPTVPEAVPPEAMPPPAWLTATFDDGDTAGSVDLTLDTTNLTDHEAVFQWLFNLDPNLDPMALDFSDPIKTGAFDNPTINTGVNGQNEYMADGDGFFDIQVVFSNRNQDPHRFGVGEAVQYEITGIPTLTADSFDFLSWEDGGQGEYPSAAHVSGIGPNDDGSGWVTVPEPATLLLLALGGLALVRRRR